MSASTIEINKTERITKLAPVFLVIGIIATAFDSIASYISIVTNEIAEEGNFILNGIFNLIIANGASTEIGFAVTMTIRAAFGVLLLLLLFLIAKRGRNQRERNAAALGLAVVGVILLAVAVYHVIGMAVFG